MRRPTSPSDEDIFHALLDLHFGKTIHREPILWEFRLADVQDILKLHRFPCPSKNTIRRAIVRLWAEGKIHLQEIGYKRMGFSIVFPPLEEMKAELTNEDKN